MSVGVFLNQRCTYLQGLARKKAVIFRELNKELDAPPGTPMIICDNLPVEQFFRDNRYTRKVPPCVSVPWTRTCLPNLKHPPRSILYKSKNVRVHVQGKGGGAFIWGYPAHV